MLIYGKDLFSGWRSFVWLLIPLLLLIPGITDFAYPHSDPRYSDMSLAHYPYALLQKEALLQEQRLRLWSPLILGGAPLTANPLAGLWYPPGWLAWILPLPFAFNLLVMLHLFWGGLGMHKLLRLEGLAPPAAVLGALAFAMMPKVFAHYGAGHITLLFAVLWTPWLLVAARQLVAENQKRRADVQSALILAVICLADIRWLPFAGAAWLLFCLHLRSGIMRIISKDFLRRALSWLVIPALAAMSAAVVWVPLLEFVPLTTRAQLSADESLAYSLPLQKLLGMLFPELGGFHEWVVYAGAGIFLLALLAVSGLGNGGRQKPWLILLVASLLFATLAGIQNFQFLANLPGMSLLRAPGRAMFLAGMALAALSAYAADALLHDNALPKVKIGRRVILALCTFVVLLLAGVFLLTRELPVEFMWGGILLLSFSLWTWLRLDLKISAALWFSGLLGMCLLDLAVMDRSLYLFRSPQDVFSEGAQAATGLSSQPGEYRIYSPSYSLPQQTAARYGLQLADGVDPLQLKEYADFMVLASGVPSDGYSVTLPPFACGEPGSDNAAYTPDPFLLGRLNVQFLVAEFDLQADGLVLRDQVGESRIYENLRVLPRAWIQPADQEIGSDIRPVSLLSWEPENIQVTAEGPGLLVLSEIVYPGWRVLVDGSAGELLEAGGLLRSVELAPGRHLVEFRFQPASLYAGASLSMLGLAAAWWYNLGKSNPSAGPGRRE